jgi:FKBP-type peptidyl-prolyl cis-trans isomerase
MPKTKIFVLSLVAAGLLLAAGTPAQQTPAANSTSTPPAAAKPATAAKSAQTPSAKSGTATAPKTAPAPLTLKTTSQKVSYALGMGLGKNLKRDSVEVEPAIILRGLKDALAGNKLLLTDDEAKAAIVELNNELRAKAEAKAKATAVENKMKGDTFLAENKTKQGVVTLPSGLQYKIITQGTGPKPAADDVVNCDYRGTLVDGTEFDSSYKRGQPLKIPVSGVIKGWTEALELMPTGSKWQLFIPSDLAYGERAPSAIGPNATLIFEVELHSIEPKPAKEPAKETPSQPQAVPSPPAQPPKDQPKDAPKEQPPAPPQPKP